MIIRSDIRRIRLKCNMDKVDCGSLDLAACGAIFRGTRGENVGDFSACIGVNIALFVAYMVLILAIEKTIESGWGHISLYCYSSMVCKPLVDTGIVS
ncbi:unnamed protein product [Sphenostylis stenocarpa]|uniref:Uncharacterized protein n=1 Tax=Sphenostylis stenocarpa TaxID=92480 RepID=A0AA86VRB3_9FABA|nr:unnamed protein product [Sphenostylis stenocarpa]